MFILGTMADNAAPPPLLQSNYYPITATLSSAAFFFLLGHLTSKNIPYGVKSEWKFKNLFVSLIHAVVCGCWGSIWYVRSQLTAGISES